ncbi:TetR/AcrR family transcriptional regulator [Ferrimonas balearica]|uniref:TetR/AcrR family transcriptional regulator n=1 Tax=Ferrimonas balearica TaxID=44012 RepID=UPI001C9942DB|nr:TetR/AcrR family transcriptional regulator [Ferrimonas balearica]MBY5992859.1 TetR/AcrR family transcriptional regulator [Ferrimonas balearica]
MTEPCTQLRIIDAFRTLLRERDYGRITIAELIARAGVGRSTFYRHFRAKLEILVRLHDRAFGSLLSELDSADQWREATPPASLVALFSRFEGRRALHRSLADALGADGEPAARRIEQALARQIEARLRHAFADATWGVDPKALALSLAGLYLTHLAHWRRGLVGGDAETVAALVHRHSRALVWDAVISD